MNTLVFNAGSSSLKYKVFEWKEKQQNVLVSGLIEGIGEHLSTWRHHGFLANSVAEINAPHFVTHEEAFSALATILKQELEHYPIKNIGHRVVHGGELYTQPTIITPRVLEAIKTLAQLAPIHNPINALGIQCAQQHFPKATHVAVFDTGFHHTLPNHVHQYAIHSETATRYQIRRYGFHGINHEYVARQGAHYLNKPFSSSNLISLHLGNGASACLIKEGQSFDTTMGMTPLAGLIMGTRCGDIDPAIPLYLQRQGMSLDDVDVLLNKESGLKGIAKNNDMRQLLQGLSADDPQAKLAIDMYVYSIQKIIGAYSSQVNALDALIFTGGVGENATVIRDKIIEPLEHFHLTLNTANNISIPKEAPCYNIGSGKIPILVIRGDEEAFIAETIVEMLE